MKLEIPLEVITIRKFGQGHSANGERHWENTFFPWEGMEVKAETSNTRTRSEYILVSLLKGLPESRLFLPPSPGRKKPKRMKGGASWGVWRTSSRGVQHYV